MKMNVLWTKQNSNKIFRNDTAVDHAHASGDGGGAPGRCCRLCGGDFTLRSFGDTYVWEGVEERYDQLLYDCFGVRVSPSGCMICELCVRQLKSTQKFKALVHAAFDKPPSEASTTHATCTQKPSSIRLGASDNDNSTIRPLKEFGLLKRRVPDQPKRDVRKKITMHNDSKGKRINIHCEVCRQRYPMIMPTDGFKQFVCSRCKMNGELRTVICRKCNIGMPPSMFKEHMELHAKADLRAKTRLRQSKMAPKRMAAHLTSKNERNLFPKMSAVAKNQDTNAKSAYGDKVHNELCHMCGQILKSREKSEQNICSHTRLEKSACTPTATETNS